MKNLLRDIKNNELKQVYLLYGEETYLVRQYRDRLKAAIVRPDDTMNLSEFEGKDCNEKTIIDIAETMPFFAQRRAIVIEDSGWTKKGGEALAEYLSEISDTTYFIIVEREVDKRNKLYKAIQKVGGVVEFSRQKEDVIIQWVVGRLNRENKKITRSVMELFLEKTGDDMERISHELEKLIAYTMDKEVIEAADVNAICCQQLDTQIYELINAIGNRQQKEALDLYYELMAQKEAPMRILFSINKQFRLLMDLRELMDQGYDYKYMSQKLGMHEFRIRKTSGQARKFTPSKLKALLRDGVATDEQIKTGQMGEQIAVELYLVRATQA